MSDVITQRLANLLGNLGLLPFFILALLAWAPLGVIPERFVELALIAYAAVILSFLGAVHWGIALMHSDLDRSRLRHALGWGVIPSLLGWLAMLLAMAGLPTWLVFLILIADLLLCRLMDAALLREYATVSAWYGSLRTRLTVGATLALAIALFSGL